MQNRNYYDEILETINKHFENDDLLSAEDLLINELKMPYIPKKYDDIFNGLLIKIKNKKADSISSPAHSIDKLMEMLYSEIETEQIAALDLISKHNLRPYIKQIKEIIGSFNKMSMKAIFFEILADQEIDIDITIDGAKMNPVNDSIFKNPEVMIALNYIVNDSKEEPQVVEAAMGEINKYILLKFPNKINDGLSLGKDILIVVKSMIIGNIELNNKQKEILKLLSTK